MRSTLERGIEQRRKHHFNNLDFLQLETHAEFDKENVSPDPAVTAPSPPAMPEPSNGRVVISGFVGWRMGPADSGLWARLYNLDLVRIIPRYFPSF